jgi:predicted ArsR family transcriptional regulator
MPALRHHPKTISELLASIDVGRDSLTRCLNNLQAEGVVERGRRRGGGPGRPSYTWKLKSEPEDGFVEVKEAYDGKVYLDGDSVFVDFSDEP